MSSNVGPANVGEALDALFPKLRPILRAATRTGLASCFSFFLVWQAIKLRGMKSTLSTT